MNKESFIQLLTDKCYKYELTGDHIKVLYQGSVDLRSLTSLPEGVQFNNQGDVDLSSLTSLPEGVQFNNQGSVDLSSLTSLPEGVITNLGIPIIEDIDKKILAMVTSGNNKLNMSDWHTCKTTHCRAGWAIHLAGDQGYDLERKFGPAGAGALIYAASRPGIKVPNFHETNDNAMNDLKYYAQL